MKMTNQKRKQLMKEILINYLKKEESYLYLTEDDKKEIKKHKNEM